MEDEKELKVSVIIPTYNFGCYIEDAIKSVLSQTYKNIEIVVVDGMSSDNTYEVLKPYLDRINYINKTKKGIIAARNAGIMSSTGHYICLLDADDIFEPNKIQEQVSFLEKYPELDFIISDFSEFDERGVIVGSFTRPMKRFQELPCQKDGRRRIYTTSLFDAFLHDGFIHPSTMLMTRHFALEKGFMDSRYPVREVYARTINTIDNLKVGYIDEVLVNRRWHKDNLSNQGDMIDSTSIRIFQDFLDVKADSLNGEQKRFILNEIVKGYWLMGRRAFLSGCI